MSVSVELIPGPFTSEMTRTAAESGLRRHPAISKGAAYALEQMNGQWVAAIVHEAAPPFGGPPADAEEEAPGPKSEGPDDTLPSPDDESSEDKPDSDSDGPPGLKDEGEGGEGHEKKEQGELTQVLDVLHAIAEALGVPIGLGDSLVPGLDGGGPPPPPGAPSGPPPPAPDKTVHQRALKPGETPPGGTPVGAPAFASVREDHPWAHLAGKIASFEVSDRIGESSLVDVERELSTLAGEIGYKPTRLREARDDDGNRVALAVITQH